MKLVAEFNISPAAFELIKENITSFDLVDDDTLVNEFMTIYKKPYGIQIYIGIENIENWIGNIKISELFGVMTLFIQSKNLSFEIRTENYHEVMQ